MLHSLFRREIESYGTLSLDGEGALFWYICALGRGMTRLKHCLMHGGSCQSWCGKATSHTWGGMGKLCKDGTRYDLGEGIGYGTLNFIGGDLAEW